MYRYHAIYISQEAEKVVGTFSDGEELSERIKSIVMRYGDLTFSNCPALSENEWSFLFDVFSDSFRYDEYTQCGLDLFIYAGIYKYKDLGQQWGIDALDLANRLTNMAYIQTCSVVEVVSRYLQNHTNCSCESVQMCLEYCGAKIK